MIAPTEGQRFKRFADDLLTRLSTRHGFLAAISVYLIAALALRLTVVPALTPDEGEQVLYAQSLELGYEPRNPPLFTWLVWALQIPFGIGLLPVALAHTACLFAFYACLYAASRQMLADKRLAALAALSPVALWFVGWDALLNYSHSLLLAACCIACLMLVWRIGTAPRLRDHVLLGVALGIGFLAKYNFVLFALALFGAAFIDREIRSRLFTRPFGLTVALAIAIPLPHGLWLLFHASDIAGTIEHVLQPTRRPGPLDNLEAGWRALHAVLSFALPFLPLFAIVFAPAFLRRADSMPQPWAPRRFAIRTLSLFLVLLVIVAMLGSLGEIRQSYMFAIAWLPLPAFLLLAPGRVDLGRMRIYATILTGLAASSLVALLAKGLLDPHFCSRCRLHVPYGVYAAAIRAAGFSTGTIMGISTPSAEPGENLRPYFPDSRVVSFKRLHYLPPPKATPAPCLIVWDATRQPDTPTWLRQEWDGRPPLLPADQTIHTVVAPMRYSQRPGMALGYAIVPADQAQCP